MSAQAPDTPEKLTLVLLLSGLWDVDNPRALQDIVWRNFRKRLVNSDDSKGESKATDLLGMAFPSIFIQFDGFFFHITAFADKFFNNPEAVANATGELRLRQAILDHAAHIHISLLNSPPEADADRCARMVGRMAAALGWSPATMAVVCPEIEYVHVWDKNVRKALRSESPVTALTRTPPNKVPVVPGDADDADLKAATEEARRRWPEFAAAFARKQADQVFAVKAPFKDGDFTEFMWIKVAKIEDEFLQGVIDNDPVNVKKYKRGTRVRLRFKSLTDWMYTEGEELIGAFTNKALEKAQEARLAKIREEGEIAEEETNDDEDEGFAGEVNDNAEPERPSRGTVRASAVKATARPISSSGALLWVFLGVGSAVLLLCGGLGIGLAVWLLRPSVSAPTQGTVVPQQPVVQRLRPHGGNSGEHIARDFAEALSRKDFHAAYICTTPAFQARQSEEQFQRGVNASRVLEGQLPFEMEAFGLTTPQEGHYNLRNKGAGFRHPPAVVIDLAHDAEGWWVAQIDWKGPAAVETPRPKPPEPRRLRERGGNSDQHIVYDFARALSNQDLKSAYACTSPDFQRKQSLELFTKAVTDSKVLEGKLPLQPQFDRVLEGQEKRWHLRHKDAPFNSPHAVILHAKPDSLGWWVTHIEWKGR